jgi:tetratricopeptide (TPR) repeat protein
MILGDDWSMNEIEDKQGDVHVLFMSYGWKDASAFAVRLCKDLTNEGYETFFDKEDIRYGDFFPVTIQNKIKKCTVFLALMSERSLEDDSICQNEIYYAFNEQKQIVPLLTKEGLRPTLLLCCLHWIDFSKDYDQALQRLLTFLRGDQKALLRPKLPTITGFIPFDFSPEIARYTFNFTGREWIREIIDSWLITNSRQIIFSIIGDPGVGKSAIIAWLSQCQKDRVVAIYFCTSKNTRTLDPFEFVASLVSQLHNQLESYAKAVEEKHPDMRRPTPSAAFRELIVEPLKMIPCPSGGKKIILIDGMNESLTHHLSADGSILRILRDQAEYLPSWLKIIITSQPVPEVMEEIRHPSFKQFFLDAHDSRNIHDIGLFIDKQLETEPLQMILLKATIKPEQLKHSLLEKNEWNFLCIDFALSNIESGDMDPSRSDLFPPDLMAFYYDHFSRTYPDSSFLEIRPILEVLVAAREPLSSEEIGSYLGFNPEIVEERLQKISPYYRKRENSKYHSSHPSFIAWLRQDVKQPSTRFRINTNHGIQVIIEGCWREYLQKGVNGIHPYTLAYLPEYLIKEKRFIDLSTLLQDPEFFAIIWEKNPFDIKRYWAMIEEQTSIRAIQAYREIIIKPTICENKQFILHLSEFLTDLNYISSAIPLLEYLLINYIRSDDYPHIELALNQLSWCLYLVEYPHKRHGLKLIPTLFRRKKLYISLKPRAWELMKLSEYFCRNHGMPEGLQRALGYEAGIYENKGKIRRAFDSYHIQQRICKQIKDDTWLQISLGNEGLLYKNLKEFDIALNLFEKKAEISKKIGNLRGYQWAMNYIGDIFYIQGNYPEAINHYKKQLEIAQSIGFKRGAILSIDQQIKINQEISNEDELNILLDKRKDIKSILTEESAITILPDNSHLLEQAKKFYDSMMNQCRLSGDHDRSIEYLENLATIASVEENVSAVLQYFLLLNSEPATEEGRRAKRNISRNLWQLYYDKGEISESFDVFVKSELVRDPMLFPEEMITFLDTAINAFHGRELFQKEFEAKNLKEYVETGFDETKLNYDDSLYNGFN